MRLSLRFLLPLALVLAGLAYAVIPLVDTLTLKWFMRLELRSQLIAGMMEVRSPICSRRIQSKIIDVISADHQDERLFAIGFATRTISSRIKQTPTQIRFPVQEPLPSTPASFSHKEPSMSDPMLIHDMSWVERRSSDEVVLFYLFAVIGVVIALVTVLVAHLSYWMGRRRTSDDSRRGLAFDWRPKPGVDLHPLAQDLRALIHDLKRTSA
jgi:trehalose 6-phosphate synthase